MELKGETKENNFAEIKHLSQVREAIHNASEFTEHRKSDYIVFNYKMGHVDTFPNPKNAPDEETRNQWNIRRECRGLIFNAQTGELLSRRYHKFFNVNELDETDEDTIDMSKPHILLFKLDGAFVAPFFTEDQGKLQFGNKTGADNKAAKKVEEFVKRKQKEVDYQLFSEEWTKKGYTLIYEYCSREEKRAVEYNDTLLILTAIRENTSGRYMLYEEMQKVATAAGIPVVEAIRDDSKSIKELLGRMASMKDIEGGVLRFDDGTMYKVKTRWYLDQGKGNSDLLCQERIIWQLILNQTIDDVKSSGIKKALKNRIDKFTKELYNQLDIASVRIQSEVDKLKEETSNNLSEFMKKISAKSKEEIVLYTRVFEGQNAFDVLTDVLLKATESANRLHKLRHVVGDIHFY